MVVNKLFFILVVHKRITLNLLTQRTIFLNRVIVSGMNQHIFGQLLFHRFQGLEHFLGAASFHIATTATKHEQGVAGYYFIA